jgi:hypothetical protein
MAVQRQGNVKGRAPSGHANQHAKLGCKEPITLILGQAPRSTFSGFVKLLRLRLSSGERVLLPRPTCPLGGPLRTCHFGPTRESIPHLLTIVGR